METQDNRFPAGRVFRWTAVWAMAAAIASPAFCATCGTPTGQPLNYNYWGDFGTIPQQTWSFQFTGTGGTPPYTFSVASGAQKIPGFQVANAPDLPNYVSAGQTAALYGIAPYGVATATPFTTQVQVTDCAGASVTHSVTVRFSPVDFNIQWLPQQVSELQNFSLPLSGIGGTPPYQVTYVSGSLPAGVALDASTNTLAGTPAHGTAGTYNFLLKIADSSGLSFERNYTINVIPLFIPAPALAPRYVVVGQVGQNLNVPLTATGGTPPYSFKLDNRDTLPSGISIASSGAIQGTPTYAFGNWAFRVDVTDSAPTPNVAAINFGMAAEGSSPQQLTVSGSLSGASQFTDATRASFNTSWINVSGGIPPYTCSLSPGSNNSLPPGTAIFDWPSLDRLYSDPLDCYVVGGPLTPGAYTFSLRVRDSGSSFADFPVTWHVSPIGTFNAYPPYNSVVYYLNTPLSEPLLPVGGTPPYTITPSIPFPDGLTVAPNDLSGTLYGAPFEAGYFLPYVPLITDSAGNTLTVPGNITIAAAPGITTLTISSGALGSATMNVPYGWNLDLLGPVHNPPYSVTLLPDPNGPNPSSAQLPTGLSLVTTGLNTTSDTNLIAQVRGTPSQAGDFSYLLNVKDAAGNVGQREISLRVWAQGQFIDDTASTAVTSSPFVYNRATKLYTGTVTVANTSPNPLTGPLFLVLSGLTSSVTAVNAAGTVASGPYYQLSSVPLAAAQSITVNVVFTDTTNALIGFTPKTYSGQPQ